jgi:uncharacterized protein (TIGR00369 family)
MITFAGTAVIADEVKQSLTLLQFPRILEVVLDKEMKFETYGNCFVCGENNPNGLRLSFEIDKQRQTLKTTFEASPTFQGWDGIVHGGIVSTLLDEAMAKLVYELGYHAVTASLEIKFKKPAPILEPLHVFGEITEVNKRLIKAKAHVAKGDGTILATGKSTFLKQKPFSTSSPETVP